MELLLKLWDNIIVKAIDRIEVKHKKKIITFLPHSYNLSINKYGLSSNFIVFSDFCSEMTDWRVKLVN